ncbi:MAG: 2-amino-4-hydroxy-6-hydroxymethyldihydropteridine diphosphokinase [Clostridia bacterium]|nr:2-amino-4-hydroxy-6-hydroxymethyldihydropteridine diphosphokinase [Clostridia bacterium]
MREKAYIALGSNMGDAAVNLNGAVAALNLVPGVTVTKVSGFYLTKPWGYADQPDFTNACCEVETSLSPEALLGVCLGIEAGMGRVRVIKNGPRVIDLDLLLYGEEQRCTEELTLPHPRMWEREFVLRPLLDLADNGRIGTHDVAAALADLPAKNC